MRVISSIEDAIEAIGQELGVSDWTGIDQKRIDAFADVTGDHQWIHVDPDRGAPKLPTVEQLPTDS